MFRQRKYVCQSQTFYQRDTLLTKVLKDAEDNFRGLEQHGKSIQRATKEMFIKFNQARLPEQRKMVENDSVGVYAMLLDLIENISHEKSLMSYVVPTLEAIISENQKQFKQFLRAITPQVVPKLKSIMFIDGYDPCVYEACAKIATMVIAEEGQEAQNWIVLLVGAATQKNQKLRIGDTMVMPIFVHLLKHEYLAIQFLKSGGIQIIQHQLQNYGSDLQIAYYTILGLWLLSYVEQSHEYFEDPAVINYKYLKLGLLKLVIETIQKISREKVLRVAFACFRNLCDNAQNSIELMVDNGLVKFIDLLLKGNLKDQDVVDDIKYVGEILEKNIKILTSFEKYQKELNSLHLVWSPVHSEKFWKENVKRFEDNDFLMIRKLSDLLGSNDPQNVAIACYDLGEFCRFHPFGKNVLDGLNAKTEIMKQARSADQTIRENALLALQKIMLHNWQVV